MTLVTDFYRGEERLRRLIRELLRVPGETLLDVGCRKGELTHLLATEGRRVVAVDLQRFDQWREPASAVRFVNADAMALPFRDRSFDLIVSGECLQYVPDWRRALDEFHRVLKPGGRVVFSCPNGNPLIDGLDPYNLIHRLRGRGTVRHLRARQLLRHRAEAWHCELFLRRGSLAFIYAACAVDVLQKWRARLSDGFRRRSRVADWLVEPLIRLLFWIMKRDFALPLHAASYNAIYRFRKT